MSAHFPHVNYLQWYAIGWCVITVLSVALKCLDRLEPTSEVFHKRASLRVKSLPVLGTRRPGAKYIMPCSAEYEYDPTAARRPHNAIHCSRTLPVLR